MELLGLRDFIGGATVTVTGTLVDVRRPHRAIQSGHPRVRHVRAEPAANARLPLFCWEPPIEIEIEISRDE